MKYQHTFIFFLSTTHSSSVQPIPPRYNPFLLGTTHSSSVQPIPSQHNLDSSLAEPNTLLTATFTPSVNSVHNKVFQTAQKLIPHQTRLSLLHTDSLTTVTSYIQHSHVSNPFYQLSPICSRVPLFLPINTSLHFLPELTWLVDSRGRQGPNNSGCHSSWLAVTGCLLRINQECLPYCHCTVSSANGKTH